nr:probable inactive poly [ADP-ribose] polymerase SRO3 [Ipomoea batatas]
MHIILDPFLVEFVNYYDIVPSQLPSSCEDYGEELSSQLCGHSMSRVDWKSFRHATANIDPDLEGFVGVGGKSTSSFDQPKSLKITLKKKSAPSSSDCHVTNQLLLGPPSSDSSAAPVPSKSFEKRPIDEVETEVPRNTLATGHERARLAEEGPPHICPSPLPYRPPPSRPPPSQICVVRLPHPQKSFSSLILPRRRLPHLPTTPAPPSSSHNAGASLILPRRRRLPQPRTNADAYTKLWTPISPSSATHAAASIVSTEVGDLRRTAAASIKIQGQGPEECVEDVEKANYEVEIGVVSRIVDSCRIAITIPVSVSAKLVSVGLSFASARRLYDLVQLLLQNYSNFKRSGEHARFMQYVEESWMDVEAKVFEVVKAGFSKGVSSVETEI